MLNLNPISHPDCPKCGAPMWLVEVDYLTGTRPEEIRRFECKACGEKLLELAAAEWAAAKFAAPAATLGRRPLNSIMATMAICLADKTAGGLDELGKVHEQGYHDGIDDHKWRRRKINPLRPRQSRGRAQVDSVDGQHCTVSARRLRTNSARSAKTSRALPALFTHHRGALV